MLVEHAFNYLIPPRLQFRHEDWVVEPAVEGGRVCAELSGDFSDRHARSQQLDGHGLLIFAALATAFGLHGPLTLGQAKTLTYAVQALGQRGAGAIRRRTRGAVAFCRVEMGLLPIAFGVWRDVSHACLGHQAVSCFGGRYLRTGESLRPRPVPIPPVAASLVD